MQQPTPRDRILFMCALLIVASPAAMAGTTITVSPAVNQGISSGSSYTLSFTPVTNATELVSISAGTLSGGEGGTAAVSVNYTNNATYQIFSQAEGSNFSLGLSSVLQNLSFSQGDINGLIFSWASSIAPASLSIPDGTTISFTQAIPEPWSFALFGSGLIGVAVARRRFFPLDQDKRRELA